MIEASNQDIYAFIQTLGMLVLGAVIYFYKYLKLDDKVRAFLMKLTGKQNHTLSLDIFCDSIHYVIIFKEAVIVDDHFQFYKLLEKELDYTKQLHKLLVLDFSRTTQANDEVKNAIRSLISTAVKSSDGRLKLIIRNDFSEANYCKELADKSVCVDVEVK